MEVRQGHGARGILVQTGLAVLPQNLLSEAPVICLIARVKYGCIFHSTVQKGDALYKKTTPYESASSETSRHVPK